MWDQAIFCPFCGKEIGINDLVCKNCNNKVREYSTRICHGCDKTIPSSALICPFCGFDYKTDRKNKQYCAWCPKCKKYKKNIKACPECGYVEK